jgi:streptogramin lyase
MKDADSKSTWSWTTIVKDASIALGLVALIIVLLLLSGCAQGGTAAPPASHSYSDPDSQIEATIPGSWRALRRPITSVSYPPQVLAAASFPVRVPRRPPNCSPSRVLDQMPPGGALVQIFEYAPEASGRPVRVPDLPPRLARFRYADADYGPFECAGYSYRFAFEQSGRAFQAHVWLNRKETNRARRSEALAILDSFKPTTRRVARVSTPPVPDARQTERVLRLGGRPLEMAVGQGSLWVLTCDRGCTARSGPSSGRLVRVDPRRGRILDSTELRGADGLAVGPGGVFVTGFWSDTLRRLDPSTLEVAHALWLRLPFELAPGDRDFLPFDVAANAVGVWVSTARGVLAKTDPLANRVVGTVRLPFKVAGEIDADAGAVWVAAQLAGVYQVGPGSNRVRARIRVGPRLMPIAVQDVAVLGDRAFALGVRTAKGRVATADNVLARIDPASARVEEIKALQPGSVRLAAGLGALWVAQPDQSTVLRIDPESGAATDELHVDADAGLVIAGDRLWAAAPNGVIRGLSVQGADCGTHPGVICSPVSERVRGWRECQPGLKGGGANVLARNVGCRAVRAALPYLGGVPAGAKPGESALRAGGWRCRSASEGQFGPVHHACVRGAQMIKFDFF